MIKNLQVYGLENSVRVAKFAMAADATKCTDDITERTHSLATAQRGSGHDNFLKGIVVQFDVTFTVKAWTEAERYHWFDIVTSQSTMHKITKFDYSDCFCDYVTNNTRAEMCRLRDLYEAEPTAENYLRLLYNCPVGIKLTAGITTNYLQLKTIYAQRRTHRLPEWVEFCKWITTLPHSEWITREEN